MTARTVEPRRVRVTVADAWEVVPLEASEVDSIGSLKTRALAAAGIPAGRADGYEVKLSGALVADERLRLADLAVPDNAPLVVLARRRRPAR